jgi:hypothetical protein
VDRTADDMADTVQGTMCAEDAKFRWWWRTVVVVVVIDG